MFPVSSFSLRSLLVVCVAGSISSSRILKTSTNPGCSDQLSDVECVKPWLFYVQAVGPADTIHVFVQQQLQPSVLLLRAPVEQVPRLNWTRYLNVSGDVYGALEANATAALGVGFSNLIEYDDPKDTGTFNEDKFRHTYYWPLAAFKFGETAPIVNGSRVTIVSQLSQVGSGWLGNLTITFDISDINGHSGFPSNLQLSQESSLVQVSLSDVRTESGFNHSRFGLVILTVNNKRGRQFFDTIYSNDDEYSPGDFKLMNIHLLTQVRNNNGSSGDCSSRSVPAATSSVPVAPGASSSAPGSSPATPGSSPAPPSVNETGYLQWRPVCYTKPYTPAALPSASAANLRLFSEDLSHHYNMSALLRSYFDRVHERRYTVAMMFGAKGDGWYRRTNFTTWYFVVSLGAAPVEHLSLFVHMLLVMGSAAPLVLVVFGTLWLCRRRQIRRAELVEDPIRAPLISDVDE